MILLILLLLIAALAFSASPYNRYGVAGWSPAGIVLLVLLVLYLTGSLHGLR